MKQITLQYKNWKIEYKVTYPGGTYVGKEHKHSILLTRNNDEVSYMFIWSKKKNLDPELFYECHELYMSNPHWSELGTRSKVTENFTVWNDEIIPQLVELAKIENKRK